MHTLKSFILANTKHGNHYLFDRKKKSFLLCNPVLFYLLKLEKEGTDLREWIEQSACDPVTIVGLGACSKKDLDYYYRKYLFLKQSGYFSRAEPQETSAGGYFAPEMIRSALINSRQVTFEVTERCNLNCKYCGYGELYEQTGKRGYKDLSVDAAKRLLTYLFKLWNSPENISHNRLSFISFYGGEPLLGIDFIKEIVHFVETQDIQHNTVIFSMTTNGLLLEKHMDYLVEKNIRLLISLDGDETHNGYRVLKNGKPAFKQIIKNIEAVAVKYPEYFKTMVNFNAVLHKLNNVNDVETFVKERFGRVPRVAQLNDSGVKKQKKKEFRDMYYSLRESYYKGAPEDVSIQKELFMNLPSIKTMTIFLLNYCGFSYEDYSQVLSPQRLEKKIPPGTCFPFAKKIFVAANGNLLPCEKVDHQFKLGKVSDTAVEIDCDDIAKKYNALFESILKQCNRCYNKEACTVCLLQLDSVKHIPRCDQVMNETLFSQFLKYTFTQMEFDPKLYPTIMEEVIID